MRNRMFVVGLLAVTAAPCRDEPDVREVAQPLAVYDALHSRASCATTGVRAWLSFEVDGSAMGTEIDGDGDEVSAEVGLAVGMTIRRIELWAAPSGEPDADYQLLWQTEPRAETAVATVAIEKAALDVDAGTELDLIALLTDPAGRIVDGDFVKRPADCP